GLGRDVISGGDGADAFIFATMDDAGNGKQRDTITDFTRGRDLIELSSIDANSRKALDQSFNFIGGAAFSGRPAESRYEWFNTAGAGIVSGDVNGDGIADFSIRLIGVQALSADDFAL